MMFPRKREVPPPLVQELAAEQAPLRVPAAVTCRVLGFSQQGYYQWLKSPVSAREAEEQHLIEVLRELHEEDPEGGYRVLSHDLADLGYSVSAKHWISSALSQRSGAQAARLVIGTLAVGSARQSRVWGPGTSWRRPHSHPVLAL